MHAFKLKIIFRTQLIILFVTYYIFALLIKFKRSNSGYEWVVGNHEVAGILYGIGTALPNTRTVNFSHLENYEFKYDIQVKSPRLILPLVQIVVGPILLGYFTSRTKGFVYLANSSFMLSGLDFREFEFRFIRSKNLNLVVYLTGSEIRSTLKMQALAKKLGEENLGTISARVFPELATKSREESLKKNCQVIDAYATHVFNAEIDQLTYLKNPALPFLYFCPDDYFLKRYRKPLGKITICHAVNEPLIKGTDYVRKAISELKRNGYEIEYIELIGVDHATVLRQLENSHICINELYSYMPGVFSIEAMSKYCLVFTRATSKIELSLPKLSENSWVESTTETLYLNLRHYIENPSLISQKAIEGHDWAKQNASISSSRIKLQALLD
jgi:hypothetical protein